MEHHRDGFLHELIRLEGRRGATVCSICKDNPALYCCDDCLTINLYCKRCLLTSHETQALHTVKVWVV